MNLVVIYLQKIIRSQLISYVASASYLLIYEELGSKMKIRILVQLNRLSYRFNDARIFYPSFDSHSYLEMTAGRDYPFFLSTSAIQSRGGSHAPRKIINTVASHRRVWYRMIHDVTIAVIPASSYQFIALVGQICHFENCRSTDILNASVSTCALQELGIVSLNKIFNDAKRIQKMRYLRNQTESLI